MRKILLILLSISSLAVAEKYALLVGINDYQMVVVSNVSPISTDTSSDKIEEKEQIENE